MLRKLKLYGELATFVGHKEFEIQVHNLPQAISFLVNNFPKVEKYMNPKHYLVKVGNYEITENEIHDPIGQQDIHIIPVISGAGGDTFNTILLGAALIGASFFFPGAGLFGYQAIGATGAAGATLLFVFFLGLQALDDECLRLTLFLEGLHGHLRRCLAKSR